MGTFRWCFSFIRFFFVFRTFSSQTLKYHVFNVSHRNCQQPFDWLCSKMRSSNIDKAGQQHLCSPNHVVQNKDMIWSHWYLLHACFNVLGEKERKRQGLGGIGDPFISSVFRPQLCFLHCPSESGSRAASFHLRGRKHGTWLCTPQASVGERFSNSFLSF